MLFLDSQSSNSPVRTVKLADANGVERSVEVFADRKADAQRIANFKGFADTASNTTLFLARELEELDSQFYRAALPPLDSSFLSTKMVGAGRDVYKFKTYAQNFRGQLNADERTLFDSQATGLTGSSSFMNIDSRIGYIELTDGELRAAMDNGMPLETESALALRSEMELFVDQVAMVGDLVSPTPNALGLLNAAGTSTVVLDYHTGGSDGRWFVPAGGAAVKTSEEILNDMFAVVNAMPDLSNEEEKATHLILPATHLRYIQKTKATSTIAQTIAEAFQIAHPEVTLVGTRYMGTPSTTFPVTKISNRLVAVNNRPDKVVKISALLPTLFPAQTFGLVTKVPAKVRCGGTCVRYLKAVCIGLPAAGGI